MSYFGGVARHASIIAVEVRQAASAAWMSRARSWVSQVKPSPMVRISTWSGNRSSTGRSPVSHLPLTYCTMPTLRPLPIALRASPKAAVDLPFALAGMDDQQTLFLGLGGQHLVAGALAVGAPSHWRVG